MKIFLGGAFTREEFYEIERDVRLACERAKAQLVTRERIAADSERERFEDESLDDPNPSLRSLRDVDLFVLCRSFPNEFNRNELETIRRVAPLAPIIIVAGALCEGEDRFGESFEGTRRFYLGSWRSCARRELERFLDPSGSAGLFVASPLATFEDLAREHLQNDDLPHNEQGDVAILVDDPELARLLAEACENTKRVPKLESFAKFDPNLERNWRPTSAIVDAVDLADPELPNRLFAIKRAFPNVPIALLAFAPRPDEIKYYERRDLWGRVRVVPKPFEIDELFRF